MKRFTLGCIALLCLYIANAQKDCKQEDYVQQLIAQDPSLRVKFDQIHLQSASTERTQQNIAENLGALPDEIVIPVVVHILYNQAGQNVSDEQVQKQLEVLNADFGGTNVDRVKVPDYFKHLTGNTRLRFALAKVDPKGFATNGIVRKQTGIQNFSIDDRCKFSSLGGDDAWDANRYLNIWVCNLLVLGYSSLPGGPLEKDGVVIKTSVFGIAGGAYGLGRTATHELGHWLGLKHIWGEGTCGDDGIDDTPQQKSANRGCPSGVKFTCGSSSHGDMYMNFMDLSDDACMQMFSIGQTQKMRGMFLKGMPKAALLNSNALTATPITKPVEAPVPEVVAVSALRIYPNPANAVIHITADELFNINGKTIGIYNMVGQKIMSVKATSHQPEINISRLNNGSYFVKIEEESKMVGRFIKR